MLVHRSINWMQLQKYCNQGPNLDCNYRLDRRKWLQTNTWFDPQIKSEQFKSCQCSFVGCGFVQSYQSLKTATNQISYALSICTWFLKSLCLKNHVQMSSLWKKFFLISSKSWIFAGYTGSKNPVRNRLKIQFIELDFTNLIFQKSSTDGQGKRLPLHNNELTVQVSC